ncbi:hypothetical protein GF377_09535 [candidate division GN15 bacterium]|nr:hypothetical protein [candidate division GN15 bacterium]
MGRSAKETHGDPLRLLGAVLLAVAGVVLLRTAWVCDDAYISFRVVDNFVNGYGLTWNVTERVQAFTNPLWVLVMSAFYAVTGDVYYTSIFLSFVLTLAALWLLVFRVARTRQAGIVVLLVLILSKAFIDYSTSGLENPLSHLLLVVFFWLYFRDEQMSPRTFFWLTFVAALGLTNRLDLGLLFLPPLLFAATRMPWRRALKLGSLGLLPIVAWEVFAIIYYGFPFPNTYYAKLHGGIPSGEMAVQGLIYLLDSVSNDPITLMATGMAVVLAAIAGQTRHRVVALAVLLCLAYVVRIGGDFMSGRFLVAQLLVAAILLTRLLKPLRRSQVWTAGGLILGLGLLGSTPTVTSDRNFAADSGFAIPGSRIADERACYYQSTGLLHASRDREMPNHKWRDWGRTDRDEMNPVEVASVIGFQGFFAGPTVHYIDLHALSDPLLARLPTHARHDWRSGHLARKLPAGYSESVASDTNLITDPGLAAYYGHIRTITRAKIWSTDRLFTILRFNLGWYEHLKDEYCTERQKILDLADLSQPKNRGTVWNAPGNVVLDYQGMVLTLADTVHADRIEISVDHNDQYVIEYLLGDKSVGLDTIEAELIPEGGLRVDTVALKTPVFLGGFDRLVIVPWEGDGFYSVGHIRVLPVSGKGQAAGRLRIQRQ